MDCTNCGACCLAPDIPVDDELDVIDDEHINDDGCLKHIDGHCVFFNVGTRRCDNYFNRPYVCRRFPPGSARCLYTRLWADIVLDWFTPGRPYPGEARILTPFEPVIEPDTLRVVSIPGYSGERVEKSIAAFNEALEHAPCW